MIARLLAVSACMALSAFFVYFPITDTDIFWHIAAGREMLLHRHFLFCDPFSFSIPFANWTDLHWLFQITSFGLYSLGAEKALIAFKLVIIALVSGILCCTYRTKQYIVITALTTAVLIYEARYLICLRPVLITILCMALYIYLFENARDKIDKKTLWLCIPLQILWTNSQGLYMTGLFIIGAYWFESIIPGLSGFTRAVLKGKKSHGNMLCNNTFQKGMAFWTLGKPCYIGLLFILCAASCLINPYGLDGLALPFRLIGRINPDPHNIFSMNIPENVPLFSLVGYEAAYRTIVFVSAIIACILFVINRKAVRPAHIILFAGFSYLAVSAERNVLLYIIAIIPVIGYHAAYFVNSASFMNLRRKTRRILLWVFGSAALSLISFFVLCQAEVVSEYPPGRNLSPFRFPEKICEYLKKNPVDGNMFNDIRSGGYLIWNFFPDKQVFIDGRLIIRPERFFAEYLALCENPELFFRLDGRFNITHVILPSAIFPLYHKLISRLYESHDWHLQYTDGSSVLFVKNTVNNLSLNLSDSSIVTSIIDSINVQWVNAPAVKNEALGYFSEMLGYLGLAGPADLVKMSMGQSVRSH
jgi:hypothetical protein